MPEIEKERSVSWELGGVMCLSALVFCWKGEGTAREGTKGKKKKGEEIGNGRTEGFLAKGWEERTRKKKKN